MINKIQKKKLQYVEIDAYETDDGRVFDSLEKAEKYDKKYSCILIDDEFLQKNAIIIANKIFGLHSTRAYFIKITKDELGKRISEIYNEILKVFGVSPNIIIEPGIYLICNDEYEFYDDDGYDRTSGFAEDAFAFSANEICEKISEEISFANMVLEKLI
jgi:uncharacterized protein (UPF0212 family)